MMDYVPPTPSSLDELEKFRDRLSKQIEEAQRLFDAEGTAMELMTSKSGLQSINELIQIKREQLAS